LSRSPLPPPPRCPRPPAAHACDVVVAVSSLFVPLLSVPLLLLLPVCFVVALSSLSLSLRALARVRVRVRVVVVVRVVDERLLKRGKTVTNCF